MAGIKDLLREKFTGTYRCVLTPIYPNGDKTEQAAILQTSDNIMPAIEILQSSSFRRLASIRGDGIDIVNLISGYRLDILLISDAGGYNCGNSAGTFPVLATKDIIKPAIRPLSNSKWVRSDIVDRQEKYDRQKTVYESSHE